MKICLISENYLRTNFQLSDNLQSKFLIAAIENAQEVYYQSIIGSCLYNRLLEGIEKDDLTEAEKHLLDISKRYIGFMVMSELCEITSYKLNNAGVNNTGDDRMNVFSVKDVQFIKKQFVNKADFYAKNIQRYLLQNQKLFPELSCCDCHNIKSNLYSAASCGVNLGGARGKRVWRTT